jgi:uncharacterized protein (DUF2147 family)
MALARFRILGIAATMILAGAAPRNVWAQSDVTGRWVPPGQDSIIEVYQCGDEVCGRVSTLDEPLDDSSKAKVDQNNQDESLRG